MLPETWSVGVNKNQFRQIHYLRSDRELQDMLPEIWSVGVNKNEYRLVISDKTEFMSYATRYMVYSSPQE